MNAREKDRLEKLAHLAKTHVVQQQENAPGYLWNPSTQELIEILPENHPQYQQNLAIRLAAIERWDKGASK